MERPPEPGVPGLPAEPPDDLVQVGYVQGAFGIKGEVKLVPASAPSESAIRGQKELWFGEDRDGVYRVQVDSLRAAHECFIAKLVEVPTREDALALGRLAVWVSRSRFPGIRQAGEYYWVDLIGCQALSSQGELLGLVKAMDDHGAHPLMIIDTELYGEQMIPFVAAYVLKVDLAARQLTLDWLPEYFQ